MTPHHLAHAPIRPPRPGHVGEEVYAARWRLAMLGPGDDDHRPIDLVLGGGMRPSLRRSRVAASLICWLGTNCGQSLIWQARRLEQQRIADPFLVAWSLENVRKTWVNGGVRTVEHLLAKPEDYITDRGIGGQQLRRRPAFSADDLEVLDRLALWLWTRAGQDFIRGCEAAIEDRRQAERERTMQVCR